MAAFFQWHILFISYIGSTDNPERRIIEHNSGNTKSTRPYRPWRIVFLHEFELPTDGSNAERKLKALKNRKILENIINGSTTIDSVMKW